MSEMQQRDNPHYTSVSKLTKFAVTTPTLNMPLTNEVIQHLSSVNSCCIITVNINDKLYHNVVLLTAYIIKYVQKVFIINYVKCTNIRVPGSTKLKTLN